MLWEEVLTIAIPSVSFAPPRFLVMVSKDKLKSIGKQIIEYPEDAVPVVSTKDWVRGLSRDPVRDVSHCLSISTVYMSLHCCSSVTTSSACSQSLDG